MGPHAGKNGKSAYSDNIAARESWRLISGKGWNGFASGALKMQLHLNDLERRTINLDLEQHPTPCLKWTFLNLQAKDSVRPESTITFQQGCVASMSDSLWACRQLFGEDER